MCKPIVALVALLSTGCATTYSTMDTARTTPRGHVQFNYARGIFLPLGPSTDLLSATGGMIKNALDDKEVLTHEEAQHLYDFALGLALQPPAWVDEFQLRTGVAENLDVGLRYSVTQLRLDAKARFFHSEAGHKSQHASIGLGASKYLFNNPLFEWLDYVKLSDFSRWDLEVPLLYSFEYRDSFMLYCGAKYVYTRFSIDQDLFEIQRRVSDLADQPAIVESIDANMHFFGSVFGLGGGYKHVFFFTELNYGYVYLRPEMYSFIDKQRKQRNLGGLTLHPAIGILVRI
jgi:hypothetical protein